MSYLDKLKQNRGQSFEKLNQQLQSMNNGNREEDASYWMPELDKAGNGYAVIRFLPEPEGEDVAFVKVYDHSFQGPGGWYIESSLATIGQPDPVGEYNNKLWNSGIESNKEIVRKQKRRTRFVSNILVIKHPTRPEDEGKVFRFRYGKKIFEKIKDVMYPTFPDEKPMNPFDIFEGADFNLKIRKVDGYPNYDKSEFSSPSPLSENDKELERILGEMYSLKELLDPKNFKSYDELKARFDRVIGSGSGQSNTAKNSHGEDEFAEEEYRPKQKATPQPSDDEDETVKFSSYSEEEDEEDLSFFKNLTK